VWARKLCEVHSEREIGKVRALVSIAPHPLQTVSVEEACISEACSSATQTWQAIHRLHVVCAAAES
jgi:hypothetical protein